MGVIIRAAILYFVVLLMLRITTRRIIRSATPLDLAVIFLLGGAAIQSILGADRSITGAILAIGTIAFIHILLSRLKARFRLVGMLTDGTPVLIFSNGRFHQDQMRALRMHESDVLAEMRQNGITSLDAVDSAIVEHNGGITLIRKQEQR